MATILDRYILKTFIKFFIMGSIICGGLVLFSRGLEMTRPLGVHGAPWYEMVWYLFFDIPWVIREIMPTVILLATFFAYGFLKRNSELTAMLNGGISFLNLIRSVFFLIILIIAAQIAAEEFLLPYTTANSRIHKNIIRGREAAPGQVGNIIVRISPGIILHMVSLDIEKNKMIYPRYMKLDENGNISLSIDANMSIWDESKKVWKSTKVVSRSFSGEKLKEERFYSSYVLPVPYDLNTLLLAIKSQRGAGENYYPRFLRGEGASIKDLFHAMIFNQIIHFNTSTLLTTLYYKILFPFTYIIILFIGFGVAMRVGRGSSLNTNFGIAILFSFLYWGFIQIFRTLGNEGTIPGWLAILFPSAPFGIIGWRLLRTG